MSDDFLVHYNRELLSIRRAAARFAAENPRIAARLRVSEDAVEDPHVDRLIESFAYLTARIRQKLDDDFPELTDSLLSILYPHFGRPIPSMAILQLEPVDDLAGTHMIPAGTLVEAEAPESGGCRFRTSSDVMLYPVRIKAAEMSSAPLVAPDIPQTANAAACLRICLEMVDPEATFAQTPPEGLRFFLRGQPQLVYPLYEALLNDTVAVGLAEGPGDSTPIMLGPSAISPGGFEEGEDLLPYPGTSHPAFRILTEYFAFPEKFLFLDIAFPPAASLSAKGRSLDIFVWLKQARPYLEKGVGSGTFALGCTPIVNLFPQTAEPVTLDRRSAEYRIVPDSRRSKEVEIYSIEGVYSCDSDGSRQLLQPFYGVQHSGAGTATASEKSAWWYAARHEADRPEQGGDLFLSLVDLDFRSAPPGGEILLVETLCTNGNRPQHLPFGGGQPQMHSCEPTPLIKSLRLMTAPTSIVQPISGDGNRWRLISHLALNHLSIVSEGGLETLREILMLYDFRNSPETRALIEGIIGVSARRGTARVRVDGESAICRGIDITASFEESHYSGNSAFLMASILERFLGLYASVNSFTRLTAIAAARNEVLKKWPARAGDRVLL